MKVTHIDHGTWTEDILEPDDPPSGKGHGHADAKPKIKVKPESKSEAKTDVITWPVLDEAAYYGLAGEVVNALLPNTEAAPAALLLQYLASFGNVIGRKPCYRMASVNHYTNIYVNIAGRTARSRKGTSAQDIRTVMEIAAFDWTRDNVKSGITSGEGIIEKVRDPRFVWDKKEQTMVCTDPGVDDKRMLLDEREFSSALGKMKQETRVQTH